MAEAIFHAFIAAANLALLIFAIPVVLHDWRSFVERPEVFVYLVPPSVYALRYTKKALAEGRYHLETKRQQDQTIGELSRADQHASRLPGE